MCFPIAKIKNFSACTCWLTRTNRFKEIIYINRKSYFVWYPINQCIFHYKLKTVLYHDRDKLPTNRTKNINIIFKCMQIRLALWIKQAKKDALWIIIIFSAENLGSTPYRKSTNNNSKSLHQLFKPFSYQG